MNDFSNVNNLKILKILPKYIHNDELAEFCNEFFTALNKHVPVNKNTFDPIIRAIWLTSSKRKLCFALALTLCTFIKRRANLISEIIICLLLSFMFSLKFMNDTCLIKCIFTLIKFSLFISVIPTRLQDSTQPSSDGEKTLKVQIKN